MSRRAKPMSMVMPRAFSSGSRSQSMPVRALTRDVLPWSMCPAVPRMRSRGIAGAPPHGPGRRRGRQGEAPFAVDPIGDAEGQNQQKREHGDQAVADAEQEALAGRV